MNCTGASASTNDTHDCYNFKQLDDRDKVEILKKKGVCYNCMTDQHMARYCYYKRWVHCDGE